MDGLKFFACVLCFVEVNSMAISGPVLTRYDPCGLGRLYFDKIKDMFWKGVVRLDLYPELRNDLVIEVDFEKQVIMYGATQNSSLRVSENWHNLVFRPKPPIGPRFAFFVKIQENQSDVPIVKRFALNNVTLCDDAIKSSQTVDSFDVTEDQSEHVCGRRSLNHEELTSLRTESKAGDWPWHVAIFKKDLVTGELTYECGGNIISRTTIVTAGHCVSRNGIVLKPERLVVVAGVDNYTDANQIGRQYFVANKVILHPDYDDELATSDLAIIKINKLKYTEYVQPICVWGPVYEKNSLIGQQATVVGFGTTENDQLSEVLRSTSTLIQNDTTCIDFSQSVYKRLMNEFTFCAGYGPESLINPRNGDSGGGLVVSTMQPDNKISWFLRGILSKCGVSPKHTSCDPTYYVVYTDVAPHYGWLYHHSDLQFRSNIML